MVKARSLITDFITLFLNRMHQDCILKSHALDSILNAHASGAALEVESFRHCAEVGGGVRGFKGGGMLCLNKEMKKRQGTSW